MREKLVQSNFFIFCLLSIIAFLLVKATLFIGFNIDDDHQFISMSNKNGLFYQSGNSLAHFYSLQKSWFDAARFFPLLTTIVFLKANILGNNYLIHHLIVFFSGVLSSFFVFKIARIKNFSVAVSLIGALVFYTGHEYGEIFWRLVCGEGPGVLFFLIGFYYTLKYFKLENRSSFWLSILFLTLAALTKESFILLMPIVFVFPLIGMGSITEAKEFITKHKHIYAFGITIFILLIGVIAFMLSKAVKMFDYGSPLNLRETIINNSWFVVKWFFPFIPIVLFGVYLALKNKSYRLLLHLSFLTFIWIAVHLIIYHKVIISFSMGKYIMPGGLILIILLMYCLEYIRSQAVSSYKICMLLTCLIIVRNAKITYINANEFAAKVSSFNKLIDQTIASKQPYIAINGGAEFYISVESHFKLAGYRPVIYSSKAVKPKTTQQNKYQNDAFEDAIFSGLAIKYPPKTLPELAADSTVGMLIVAEPLEGSQLNEDAITPYFPKKSEVSTKFNNPTFPDLFKVATWKGDLNNDKVTYTYFCK
jgi:hypothetical protein